MHFLCPMKANGNTAPRTTFRSASPDSSAEDTRTKATRRERKQRVDGHRNQNMGAGAVSGAIAGAAAGVLAGPAGAIAGASIGAVAGAAAGVALADDDERASMRDEELDKEIGVTEGELGTDKVKHPPAKVGAYSSGTTGGAPASTPTPSSGPMSNGDE